MIESKVNESRPAEPGPGVGSESRAANGGASSRSVDSESRCRAIEPRNRGGDPVRHIVTTRRGNSNGPILCLA